MREVLQIPVWMNGIKKIVNKCRLSIVKKMTYIKIFELYAS